MEEGESGLEGSTTPPQKTEIGNTPIRDVKVKRKMTSLEPEPAEQRKMAFNPCKTKTYQAGEGPRKKDGHI